MSRPAARSRRRPAVLLATVFTGLALAGLALAGCSGDDPPAEAVFQVQKGVQPQASARPCQLHQTDRPTTAFRGGPKSDPSLELPFLAYFTANGDKRYCDGKPPTTTDKEWARLYVQLTGNSAAVKRILSG